MPTVEHEVLTFGEFTLAPNERLLLRRQQPVSLTPKAFDLLVILVRRSGHLISKEDLLREVWPGTYVEEVNLTVYVSGLRKVLDGGRNGTSMIETVPTRGYRFVAPVTMDHSEVVHRNPQVLIPKPGSGVHRRQSVANPDSYRAYLRGRYEWNQRSKDSIKRGMEQFRAAVELDPTFAEAYSGLADSYAALGYLSYESPSDAFPTARRYSALALQLDGSLAEAHASLGFVKLYFDWDWRGAEAEFEKAIAVDPNYGMSHEWYSIYLTAAGRARKAFEEIQLACECEPLSLPINSDLGFYYYYTGQYDEAVKQLKFVLEMNKAFPPAHLWLGRTLQELGRLDDALTEFRQVEESLPGWPVSVAARGFVAGLAGRKAEAEEILEDLERLAAHTYVTPYGVALVHAGLGDQEAAFAHLNKAFVEKSNWLVWLRLDPRWNRLRSDTRFMEMVRRMQYPSLE
jgi:DNA-binding winged helix-turn-helix (wHTH) protein/Flp pilus assembly protein TadD